MPVTFTVHPCRTARDRELAHSIERKLDLRNRRRELAQVQADLMQLVPGLRHRYDHNRTVMLVSGRDERGRPCATVYDLGKPYITITHIPA
jgi:hypothetical protein